MKLTYPQHFHIYETSKGCITFCLYNALPVLSVLSKVVRRSYFISPVSGASTSNAAGLEFKFR